MNELGAVEPSIIGGRHELSEPTIREVLRAATQEPHERLHRHAGFSQVKEGTITLPDYRALLSRLYGFYLPFERAVGAEAIRTRLLANDLAELGSDGATLSYIPLCAAFPRYDCPERRLGALYVVEGSALGGRQLFRGLEGLFGEDSIEGRRFFAGRGSGTGDAWLAFLDQLERVGPEPAGRGAVIGAAVETFEVFETWLRGWSDLT